jgi:hypothetical protein
VRYNSYNKKCMTLIFFVWLFFFFCLFKVRAVMMMTQMKTVQILTLVMCTVLYRIILITTSGTSCSK